LALKATEEASVVESGDQRAGRDEYPSWVIPFWMLLALAATFFVGYGCGSFVTWLSMLGPLGPGDGPPGGAD
jgi:hypothetical protein